MIARIHRFQGYGSLRFVYQKGQTIRGPFCSLKYALNKRRDTYRIAVVVSRKVHKSAVVRNRIRRRIYEIMRLEAMHIVGAYDIVITVYSDQLAAMPSVQLHQAIVEKLEKAAILSPKSVVKRQGHAIVEPKEN